METVKRVVSLSVDQAEDFLAILDEDVVWDPGERWPGGKSYGRDGVRQFFREWIGAFEDLRYEAVEFVDAGDSAVVHMRFSGRGKGSGASADADFWQVWHFFEGKVVRFVMKPSRADALEVAGLSE